MKRSDKIRHTILHDIKPKGCKVVYFRKATPWVHSHYDAPNRTARISLIWNWYGKATTPYFQLHTILHEICHDITWDKNWKLDGFVWKNGRIRNANGWRHKISKTYYLAEYKAEKLLRKICHEKGWGEILAVSDYLIRRILEDKPVSPWGHLYMAKRIQREELIPWDQ